MRTFLREPLVHFLALGAIVFVLFGSNAGSGTPVDGKIIVNAGRVEQLVAGFTRTWQRPPSQQERDALVEDFIREEVFYREALAIGLDKDDTIVRRRMRQKLEFLTEDASIARRPTDQELQRWLDAHPERFRVGPSIAFSQVYFNPGRPGDNAFKAASRALGQLRAAQPDSAVLDAGDATMLPPGLPLSGIEEVASVFGDRFARQIAQLPVNQWAGPVESGYGWHLVYVSKRSEGASRPLGEVREAVQQAWTASEHARTVEASYQKLRARYVVQVDTAVPAVQAAPVALGSAGKAPQR